MRKIGLSVLLIAGILSGQVTPTPGVGKQGASGPIPALVTSLGTMAAGTFTVTTSALNTTGANLIVVSLSYYAGSGPTVAVTDSKGNTYTALTRYGVGAAADNSQLWYAENATVGSGHTVTVTGGGAADCYFNVDVLAFSNIKTSSSLDSATGASAFATAQSVKPGSTTPSAGGYRLLVTNVANGTAAAVFAVNAGFSIDAQSPNGPSVGGAAAYQIQAVGSNVDPTWSIIVTDTNNWGSGIAVFKGA